MELTYDALNKNIDTKLEPIYLLYGVEQYLIEKTVDKIKKKFGERILGINYILIDESSIEELIPNIEMPAFGYDKKLIIIKDSGIFKKIGKKKKDSQITYSPIQEKIANYIKENYDIIEENVILVFVEIEADKNIVFEAINKNGIICNAEELTQMEIVKKLKHICNLYKVNCAESTLKYLVEVSGTNFQNLINEIRKLIEYAGENGTITIDDINNLSTKQMESIIFELTDNLATKKIDKALEVLDNLIYQKEPIQKILITLYNHFKKVYLCNEAIKYNKDVVSFLNLKPTQTFLVTKYKKQASYFKNNQLRELMTALINLDYNYKIGKIDLDIGLRSILCNYCS